MLNLRHALAASAAALMLFPAGQAQASLDGEATVRTLATDAAQLLAEEVELINMVDSQSDAVSTELAAVRAQLRTVDGQGQAALIELQGLGVELTPAIETTLGLLPQGDDSPGAVRLAPQSIVYEAAITDLVRIAASPAAVSTTAKGSEAPSYALLMVAAVALFVLGAAALTNTLWRRPESEELTAMAWSDGLTGLANRRRLDHDLIDRDIVDGPTAVIMVDVDHFKAVNDQFGHKVGDEILCSISDQLAKHVRTGDVVYRYGGEEFCVLLPNATEADAASVADRIVMAARSVTLPDGANITVSVGVAHADSPNLADALDHADQALYTAKSEGRDRAVHARGDLINA